MSFKFIGLNLIRVGQMKVLRDASCCILNVYTT